MILPEVDKNLITVYLSLCIYMAKDAEQYFIARYNNHGAMKSYIWCRFSGQIHQLRAGGDGAGWCVLRPLLGGCLRH